MGIKIPSNINENKERQKVPCSAGGRVNWPGCPRELEQVLEYLVKLGTHM